MAEKKEKIYAAGLRTFPKHENAPDFVLGTLIITPNELFSWLKENEQYLTEYKDTKQLKLQILNGDKGIYTVVDTWKPSGEGKTETAKAEAPSYDPPF